MEGSCDGSGDEDGLVVRLRDLRCIFANTMRRRFKVKIHYLFALSVHSFQRQRVPMKEVLWCFRFKNYTEICRHVPLLLKLAP